MTTMNAVTKLDMRVSDRDGGERPVIGVQPRNALDIGASRQPLADLFRRRYHIEPFMTINYGNIAASACAALPDNSVSNSGTWIHMLRHSFPFRASFSRTKRHNSSRIALTKKLTGRLH